ncbi:unnamed protein product [Agarophyton chilense]|eukprot:gb/GEZJ01003051.1/.p1 GENE.gb/GEZJ01003051.1/~~gb/GEZJ01003051.1/.p1  ORF type:complete len:1459 (+),score=202.68 gb/GEZJ01003051.1/:413-4789(+)
MDTGGSFLDFACVRVALIPAGPALCEQRFEELTLYLTWLREIPTGALPRRTTIPRASTNATYSSMPAAYREAWGGTNEALLRSRSSMREASRSIRRSSLLSLKPASSRSISNLSTTDTNSSASIKLEARNPVQVPKTSEGTSASSNSEDPSNLVSSEECSFEVSPGGIALSVSRPSTLPRARTAPSVAVGSVSELDLNCPEVDSCFRLRYEILHRNTSGGLVIRPPSEWDAFHSSKVWAVFGMADVTNCGSVEEREKAIDEARLDFVSSLGNFRDAPVKRLVVFVPQNEERNRSFVEEEHLATEKEGDIPIFYSVGYVPEQLKVQETKLEVRAHLYQCASTLLNVIGRDCFKKQENPSELILSPIDERLGVDRQSKLSKRRPGRLDKMQGDYLLLMGRPGDAFAKYSSAIEKAKSGGDRLWLAGAMEGWSAAHVLLHAGAGRSLNDPGFCNHLVDHYAEIFKLYQKKRVAEPEAAAALRLAEFLGRWTNRRKEALDAAEHAATVGEGLRVQKRAALWQALARFSERIGCRRKAGMYLYRLGRLNAAQSVWPSAVALMSAAERQINPKGFKSWPDLSRKLLLTAANYAIDAGDSSMAARLYAEALIISPFSRKDRRETDETIVTALRKAHVPHELPGIGEIIEVSDVQALQAQDLVLRRKENQSPSAKGTAADGQRTGPFIYNAFEINEERRKAAAAARRSVTWVRGEPAQVSVSLCNRVATDLVVDLIAVLMSNEAENKPPFSKVVSKSSISLTESSSRIWVDEERSSATHAAEVRRVLDESKRIVKTKSETMAISSTEGKNGAMRHIEVVPKLSGTFFVNGLLVRLFDGILVILRPCQGGEGFQVNVIDKLPKITLTSYSTEGEATESISPRKPLCVFHGESRSFLVEMKNTGPVKINRVAAKVQSSHPDSLIIIKDNFAKHDIKEGLENHGDVRSFMVEVLGKCTNVVTDKTRIKEKQLLQLAVPKVSVQVEYEGEGGGNMIRESRSSVRINSKAAVVIRKVNIFHEHPLGDSPPFEKQSRSILAIEVSNEVAAPATIKVDPNLNGSKTAKKLSARILDNVSNILDEECFVESGASARLLCYVTHETLNRIRTVSSSSSRVTKTADGEGSIFTVRWSLPALGRQGKLPFTSFDLWRLLHQNRGVIIGFPRREAMAFESNSRPIQAEVHLQIDDSCKRRMPEYERFEETISDSAGTKVQVGCFWTVQIFVSNVSEHKLPEKSVLDVELKQLDSETGSERLHRASLVGVVERVYVGALMPHGAGFHHCIRVRVDSIGTFHLVAYLYEAESLMTTTRMHQLRSELDHIDEDSNLGIKATLNPDPWVGVGNLQDPDKKVPRSTNPSSLESSTPDSVTINKILRSDASPISGLQDTRKKRVHIGGIQESDVDIGVVIRPITKDTYSNSSANRITGRPLAVAVMEFSTERKSDRNYFTRSTPYVDTMLYDEGESDADQHTSM